MANEIYNSSDWGNGVCDNTIDWGVVYKDFAGCTPSCTNTYSLALDGVDEKLSVSQSTYSGEFTLSFWAKPEIHSNFVFGLSSSNGYFLSLIHI